MGRGHSIARKETLSVKAKGTQLKEEGILLVFTITNQNILTVERHFLFVTEKNGLSLKALYGDATITVYGVTHFAGR